MDNLRLVNAFETNYQRKKQPIPAGNYMFKVNNRNSRTRREIC